MIMKTESEKCLAGMLYKDNRQIRGYARNG